MESGFGNDLLINVYKYYDTFTMEDIDDSITNLLTYNRTSFKHQTIVDKSIFLDQFALMTNNLFDGMDWSNLLVAGSDVTS